MSANDSIAAFFERLRSQPWLTDQQRLWTRYLFHFTAMSNVPGILCTGRLLPRETLLADGTTFHDTANQEIIEKTTPETRSAVRLYFRPRVPMLYVVEGVRPRDSIRDGAHCPIPVYLLFDAVSVLERKGVRVSRGNCAVDEYRHENSIDPPLIGLESIPFDLVYHDRGYSSEEWPRIKFHRQAEILIDDHLELRHLKWIFVRSDAERQTLRSLLEAADPTLWPTYEPFIRTNVQSSIFGRRWIYLQRVRFSGNSVVLETNPDAAARGSFDLTIAVTADGRSYTHREPAYIFPRDPVAIELPPALPQANTQLKVYLDDHLTFLGTLRRGGIFDLIRE